MPKDNKSKAIKIKSRPLKNSDEFKTQKSIIKISSTTQSPTSTVPATVPASSSGKRGTIYLGRIPHGFYEQEMKEYFSQFGQVTQLYLSRNKNGASKHYAFIEFADLKVAKIVVETMNGYLLSNHVLECSISDKVGVFDGKVERFKVLPMNKIQRVKEEVDSGMRVEAYAKRMELKRAELLRLGIDFEIK